MDVNSNFEAVAGSGVTLATKDTTAINKADGTFKRLAPGAYLTGGTNSAFYAKEVARINGLDETVAPTGTVYVNPTAGKADDKFKADNINALDKYYNNNVTINHNGFFDITDYTWNSSSEAYVSETYLAKWTGSFANVARNEIPTTYRTGVVNIYWHGNLLKDSSNSTVTTGNDFLNNTYTVNGLQVKIADRYVDAPLSVEFKYTNAATTTATLVTSAKLANTANANILLSNSEFAPVTASNFDGTFTLKTADGKKLELAGALTLGTNANIFTAPLNADGSIPTTITGNAISAASVNYNYGSATGANTYALKFTMVSPVDPGAEKKLAVKLTIAKSILKLAGTTSALNSTGYEDFYFILELQ